MFPYGLKVSSCHLMAACGRQAYALKRLARGLASGRGAARQGFALALTGALAALPAVPLMPVLDLLDAALDAPASMKVHMFCVVGTPTWLVSVQPRDADRGL